MKPEHRRQVIANFLDHDGPMTLRALSVKAAIDHSTLHRDLAAMETRGRVSKEENPGWNVKGAKKCRYVWRLEA